MKKIITGAVLLAMLVLCTSLSVGAVVYGDANRDGNVDITDLIALKKYCSGYSVNIDTSAVDADQNDIQAIWLSLKVLFSESQNTK